MKNSKNTFQLPTEAEIVNAKPFSQLIAEGKLNPDLVTTPQQKAKLRQKNDK